MEMLKVDELSFILVTLANIANISRRICMFLDFCDSSDSFASRRGGDGVSRKSTLHIFVRICIFSDDAGFLFSSFS